MAVGEAIMGAEMPVVGSESRQEGYLHRKLRHWRAGKTAEEIARDEAIAQYKKVDAAFYARVVEAREARSRDRNPVP